MKILHCIIAIATIFLLITGCAPNQETQLLGRIAPESPTRLIPGKNKISFFSQGTRISGNVYLPPDYSEDQKLSALIVVAPDKRCQRPVS